MSAIGNAQLQRVKERGWQRGMNNLLQGELSAWFGSSRWWKHLLMWSGIINVLMVIMVIATKEAAKEGSEGPPLLIMYGIFGGLFVAFGVMIIMQRVIVGEKRAGTAAWVLSKPVTRTAFVLSRLAINSLAIVLTSVVVPGLLVYVTFGALTDLGWLSPLGFMAGLLMVVLHTFFWLTLVLMMGTFFDSSAGVIAVPMALYFALWFGSGYIPGLVYINPLLLTFAPNMEQMQSLAASQMLGQPVFSWLPLIATVVYCVIFVAVAIWRFNRQEF
jgi:ABC-2 type transport system permease protein